MTGPSASTSLPAKEGEDKKEEAEKEENVNKEAKKDKKEGKEEKSAEEKKVDADKADGEKSPTAEAGWGIAGAVPGAVRNFVVNQAVRHVGKVVVLLPDSMIFYYIHIIYFNYILARRRWGTCGATTRTMRAMRELER